MWNEEGADGERDADRERKSMENGLIYGRKEDCWTERNDMGKSIRDEEQHQGIENGSEINNLKNI